MHEPWAPELVAQVEQERRALLPAELVAVLDRGL